MISETFRLAFEIESSKNKIQFGDGVLFLGSCFSDDISEKGFYYGLNVTSNPFGTIFHPIVLSRFISETIAGKSEERIHANKDLYFSWDASTSKYAFSHEELKQSLQRIRKSWLEELKKARFLFVTFGTAKEYSLIQSGEIVANCHKSERSIFENKMTDVDQIVNAWSKTIHLINLVNPDLNLVFTVSPVRHAKDGLIQNNRSKAILIDSIRKLTQAFDCAYFPSFEIVLDELRDYRFFKEDRVHPNSEAINYVWDRFCEVYISDETRKAFLEVKKWRNASNHRLIHTGSEDSKKHMEKTDLMLSLLKKKYPSLII